MTGKPLAAALAVILAAWTAVVAAAPGDTRLVSINADPPTVTNRPFGTTTEGAISADGNWIVFVSGADGWVPGRNPGFNQVYVQNRETGRTERVSVTSAGVPANGNSRWPDISADGRVVVFRSEAPSLHPENTALGGLFVHYRDTGETRLIPGIPNDRTAFFDKRFLSGNGRYIVFTSTSPDLVPDDRNQAEDVFVHDLETGTTSRVSVASDGTEADGTSFGAGISSDGRFVAFSSSAPNLVANDDNGQRDVFIHDRETGTTHLVSVSSAGEQANAASGWDGLSGNGRVVAFRSQATNLVSGPRPREAIFVRDLDAGTTTVFEVPWEPGDDVGFGDVAMDHTGRYIAYAWTEVNRGETRVLVHDRNTGVTRRVTDFGKDPRREFRSTISGDGRFIVFETAEGSKEDAIYLHDQASDTLALVGVEPYEQFSGNNDSVSPRRRGLSADGRYAVFSSLASDLVADDTNEVEDVFVRDLEAGITTRVSVSSAGEQGDAASTDPSISDDGRFIVFQSSAQNLVPDDATGAADIFVHDRVTGETRLVSVSSDGVQAAGGASEPIISGNGRFVAFVSDSNGLVPDDDNDAFEVFVHDLVSGTTERIRARRDSGGFFPTSSDPSLSDDGRYVAFTSQRDLFVYDRSRQESARITHGADLSFTNAISGNGRFVAFTTNRRLVEEDTQDLQDVYVYDRATGTFELISTDSAGFVGNGDSDDPSISADGRRIAFDSRATNLASGSDGGLFVHDRLTGATVRADGSSSEQANRLSFTPTLSANGQQVLFTSNADNLTPETPTTSQDFDVYRHELDDMLEAVRPFQQSPEGLLAMEAEHFYLAIASWELVHPNDRLEPWQAVPVPDASGGEAIAADPFWRQTLDPRRAPATAYLARFTQPGLHYVWLRARSFSAPTDAFGIGLNDGPVLPRFVEPDDGQWIWLRGWNQIEVPSAGEHQFWIYRRERRVQIDKIVITPDADFRPAGFGPDESPRADGNGAPVLEPIGHRTAAPGRTLEIALTATDPDGDLLQFSAASLPAFVDLRDHGDGTATLLVTPTAADVGTHGVKIIVTDARVPNASDEEWFTIRVIGAAFQQNPGGLLSIEAEHFEVSRPGKAVGPWAVIMDPRASGGEAVKSPGRWQASRLDDPPSRAEYDVRFRHTGSHYVWVRARSHSDSTDAFFLRFGDGPALPFFARPDDGQWNWFRGWQKLTVGEAGLGTLHLLRRERNVEIDKIVITPRAGFTPGGRGPAESRRE